MDPYKFLSKSMELEELHRKVRAAQQRVDKAIKETEAARAELKEALESMRKFERENR